MKKCEIAYSYEQNLFIAGMLAKAMGKCNLPEGEEDQALVQKYIRKAEMSLTNGVMAGMGFEAAGKFFSNTQIVISGGDNFENFGCAGQAKKFVTSAMHVTAIKKQKPSFWGALKKDPKESVVQKNAINSKEPELSVYVESCVKKYQGKYTVAQCQCLGDVGQAVIPDLHSQKFARDGIKTMVSMNPMIGFQLVGQCQIGEY